MASLVETAFQTMFILDASRRSAATPDHIRKKPGRELVTFLLVSNLAMWAINTLEKSRAESHPLQLNFYGLWAWTIITHVSMPLGEYETSSAAPKSHSRCRIFIFSNLLSIPQHCLPVRYLEARVENETCLHVSMKRSSHIPNSLPNNKKYTREPFLYKFRNFFNKNLKRIENCVQFHA